MKPTTDFPFLLDNPRAWRTYLGGRMLDALHGDSNGEDGHFPEEWILSTVAARNAGREQFRLTSVQGIRSAYGSIFFRPDRQIFINYFCLAHKLPQGLSCASIGTKFTWISPQ